MKTQKKIVFHKNLGEQIGFKTTDLPDFLEPEDIINIEYFNDSNCSEKKVAHLLVYRECEISEEDRLDIVKDMKEHGFSSEESTLIRDYIEKNFI